MEAVIYIEGEIVSEYSDSTTFPCTLSSDVRYQLDWQKDNAKYLDQKIDSIRVVINSPGGSVNAGNAIVDMLDEEQKAGAVIKTYGIGLVASIATGIFCKGSIRQLSKHCKFFIHLPMGGIGGTADEIIAYGKATKNLENELLDMYEPLTAGKLTRDELFKICQDQTELTAQQAFDYGFATSVAEEVTAHKKGVLTDLPGITKSATTNKMNTKEKKEANSLLDAIQQGFAGIREDVKNMFGGRKEVKALKLTDVTTNTELTIETDGDVVEVGQKVTDADGNAVADGTYTLSNDQVITVVDGLITAVEAKADDAEDVQALKDKVAQLETENNDLKTQLQEDKTNHQTELANVQAKAQQDVEAKIKPMEEKINKLSKLIGSTGTAPRDENRLPKEEKKNEKEGEDPGQEAKRRREERKANQKK